VNRPITSWSVGRLNSGSSGLRRVRVGVAVVMKFLVVRGDIGRAAHDRPLRAKKLES
jgi:hypothetical protein